jgi:hypothetical protein
MAAIPTLVKLCKSGLQTDPVHGNLDQAVQSAGNPGLGHRSPPKRVDWIGPSQAVQSVRQSALACEEHWPQSRLADPANFGVET